MVFRLMRLKLFLTIRCMLIFNPDHSDSEHRYIIIGMSQRGRLLLIAYTERGDITRLISAREATRMERKAYE